VEELIEIFRSEDLYGISRDRRKSRQKSAKITANFYTNHEKHGKNTEITRYPKTTFLMMKK
jgi:hypothetical protein